MKTAFHQISSNFIKFHQVFIFPIFSEFFSQKKTTIFSMKKIQVPMTKLQSLWVPPTFLQGCPKQNLTKEMVDAVQRVFQNPLLQIYVWEVLATTFCQGSPSTFCQGTFKQCSCCSFVSQAFVQSLALSKGFWGFPLSKGVHNGTKKKSR